MANLGLLGAVGGLGKALETFGGDIVKRRERALEEARRLAAEERRAAQRTSDITLTHDLDMEEIGARETAADTRTQAQIDAANKRAEDQRAHDRDMQGRRETATERQIRLREQGDTRLATLRSKLERDNNADAIRLREELDDEDIERVEYGKPDKDGYAEVIKVLKNGKTVKTGEHVYKPKLDYKEDDDEEDPYG